MIGLDCLVYLVYLVGWSIWWFVRFGGCVCLRLPDWFMSIYVDGLFDVPTNIVVVRVPICSVCSLFSVSVVFSAVSVFSARICVFVGRVCASFVSLWTSICVFVGGLVVIPVAVFVVVFVVVSVVVSVVSVVVFAFIFVAALTAFIGVFFFPVRSLMVLSLRSKSLSFGESTGESTGSFSTLPGGCLRDGCLRGGFAGG